MRLMLIGTDRTVFSDGSAAGRRLRGFCGGAVTALDTIVFSGRQHGTPDSQVLGPGVHAYATQSRSRFLYGLDAYRRARTLPCPDVVSAQDPFETGLAALLIARHFRAPLVIEMHTDFLTPAFRRFSLLNRIRVVIASFVLSRAAGGYAVSEKVRKEVAAHYRLKIPIEVLPIFVNTRRFSSLPRNPQSGDLLWVGRFEKEKRPELAISAFARARADGYDIRLTMLGAGSEEARIKMRADALGLVQVVSFPGWQDPAAYLPTAELLLSTSVYEGYGMAIVEALASGVPVLSPDVGVAREAGASIAEGNYSDALKTWLAGPRARGVLQLEPYADEDDYRKRIRAFYLSFAIQKKS